MNNLALCHSPMRECLEELNITTDFWSPHPLFLTSTLTVGLTAGHTDVSLWYVLKGDSNKAYEFDKGEFNDIGWFHLNGGALRKIRSLHEAFYTKIKR